MHVFQLHVYTLRCGILIFFVLYHPVGSWFMVTMDGQVHIDMLTLHNFNFFNFYIFIGSYIYHNCGSQGVYYFFINPTVYFCRLCRKTTELGQCNSCNVIPIKIVSLTY